jgi:hypothetical protein
VKWSDILYEMSNFKSRITGLPDNLEVCTRSDPDYHGHDRYRIKVTKDREWAGVFTVGHSPELKKNIGNRLTQAEITLILQWAKSYSSLIVSLIDGKIDSAEFGLELIKIRGQQ